MQVYAPIRPDRPNNVTPIPTAVETREVVETRWKQIEEWPEVVGPEIFDEIQNWWTTYTFMTEETALLLTLWSAHANMWQGFQNTPRLVIDSPTKGCGKTLVLFDLGEMDWLVIGIPIAILYYGSYGLTLPFVKSKEKK